MAYLINLKDSLPLLGTHVQFGLLKYGINKAIA